MLPFKDQQKLVNRAVNMLCDPDHPQCLTIVLPPCFGEHDLASQLEKGLRQHSSQPAVACLSADAIPDRRGYLRALARGWQDPHLPPPPEVCEDPLEFDEFLQGLPRHRPFIQILGRFHRIVEGLDQYILGSLRKAEHNKFLRTVVLSPYECRTLARHWKHLKERLTISNYGDQHLSFCVEPLTGAEFSQELQKQNLPKHVAEFVAGVSGGLPEVALQMMQTYRFSTDKTWLPTLREEMRAAAERALTPLVEHLDVPGQSQVREAVVSLFQQRDPGAEATLHGHPWKQVLLEEGELRASGLSATCLRSLGRELGPTHIVDQARRAYRNRHYSQARGLLEELQFAQPAVVLLRAHAKVMSILYEEGANELGLDTNWRSLRRSVAEARQALAGLPSQVAHSELVIGRYKLLESLGEGIERLQQAGVPRVVDALAGDGPVVNPQVALVLLLSRLETARHAARNSEAVQAALPLPEQILRVWARWHLDLHYHQAPAGHEEAWQEVERVAKEPVPRPPPGQSFPSAWAFSMFALALALQRGLAPELLPEADLETLHRTLSALSTRNDAAHALAWISPGARERYFSTSHRWFQLLLPVCQAHPPYSMEELREHLTPLPLVTAGVLEW